MYKRFLEEKIVSELKKPDVIIINGPRRVGKTTLIRSLQKKITQKNAYFDFTDPSIISLWKNHFSQIGIKNILDELQMENEGIIFFDEIQYFENIGILLKLFYDYFPKIKVIATGSSSFLFLQNIGDALTGRKKIYTLYPLSFSEIFSIEKVDFWQFKDYPLKQEELTQKTAQILVFGSYPEIYNFKTQEEKINRLKEIVDSYLFKDLLMIETIKKPQLIVDLLRLLAYQIGSLANPNELAIKLGVSRETVLHYIDLLEKFFIIFKVYPYQENLRNAIKKKFKVYFYDLGIRNALISNFNSPFNRLDKGALLENFIVLGIKRRIDYEEKPYNIFFWQNYEKKEIDILIKNQENSFAIEVKWNKEKFRKPKNFPFPIKLFCFAYAYKTFL